MAISESRRSRPGSFSPRWWAPAAAALCLGATACSATTAASSASTSTSRSTTTPPIAPTSTAPATTVGIAGYVRIDGKRVAVPDEGTRPINPIEDVGEQIIITHTAIEPHLLFCQVGRRLTVTNLTSVTQQLRFVNDGGWRSAKIPPGGAWHYTPKYGISYYYLSSSGLQARFQASVPIPGNP